MNVLPDDGLTLKEVVTSETEQHDPSCVTVTVVDAEPVLDPTK